MRRVAPETRIAAASGAEVDDLCRLVAQRTGLVVSEAKRAVVGVRLAARARELRLRSFEDYHRLVEEDERELRYVIDQVTTHETSFFRHAHHFDFLERQLVPYWRSQAALGLRPHEVRVWSAGCSTGEEPYSIAMVLRAGLSAAAGWSVSVLATDISEAALESARAATFAADRAWQLPDEHRRLFTRDAARGLRPALVIHPEIARLVRFERVNLLDDIYPAPRDFDVVFCRNVLIYFRPEERRAVVERLVDHLAPEGHLVLGQAEGLMGAARVRRVAPTIYRLGGLVAPPSSRPPRRPLARGIR